MIHISAETAVEYRWYLGFVLFFGSQRSRILRSSSIIC